MGLHASKYKKAKEYDQYHMESLPVKSPFNLIFGSSKLYGDCICISEPDLKTLRKITCDIYIFILPYDIQLQKKTLQKDTQLVIRQYPIDSVEVLLELGHGRQLENPNAKWFQIMKIFSNQSPCTSIFSEQNVSNSIPEISSNFPSSHDELHQFKHPDSTVTSTEKYDFSDSLHNHCNRSTTFHTCQIASQNNNTKVTNSNLNESFNSFIQKNESVSSFYTYDTKLYNTPKFLTLQNSTTKTPSSLNSIQKETELNVASPKHIEHEENQPYHRNPSLDSTVSCKIPLTPPHCNASNASRNQALTNSTTTPIVHSNKTWFYQPNSPSALLNSTKDASTLNQSVSLLKTFPLLTPKKKTKKNIEASTQPVDFLHSEPDSEDSNSHHDNISRQTRSGLRY